MRKNVEPLFPDPGATAARDGRRPSRTPSSAAADHLGLAARPHTVATQASAEEVDEAMYRDVYGAIMEHRLPPGTKLTESALCQIYDTARHAVRKALGRLAADGLVELEANRGAFVASPSAAEAQEMFELRRVIERAVLDKVAASASAEQLVQLSTMVQEERASYGDGDRGRWIRLSAEFHVELARLTGNSVLVGVLRKLVSRTTLLVASSPFQNACSFDEHQIVLDALIAKDVEAAQHAMAHHLAHCEARVRPGPPAQFDLRAALGRR